MAGPCLISGLDLGKVADFSALATVDRQRVERPVAKRRWAYTLRWLETWELGTAYATIIQGVRARFAAPVLNGKPLAVDYTGVGTAVVEQIQAAKVAARLHPVLITSGHTIQRPEENKERTWHVPKKELVSTLLVVLENKLLRWTPAGSKGALPLIGRFEKELADFRQQITRSKNTVYGAEGSQHDDLVLAVALAVWLAEHVGVGDASGIGTPAPGQASVIEKAPAGTFAEAGSHSGGDPRYFGGRP